MKNPSRPHPERLLPLLALCAAGAGFAALVPTEWRHRQPLEVAAPGVVQVALPPATFDAAQPGLADLRVLGPDGRELPSLLDRGPDDREPVPAPRNLRPRAFTATRTGEAGQLLIETGTDEPLARLELETTAPFFLKAAHVDVSADGREWESLGPAVPVFRQFGAEQLHLALDLRRAAFIRVTLDDYHTRPIAFTGARLVPGSGPAAPRIPVTTTVAAGITRRDEFAGETVLTVSLPGRNLPLAALVLDVADPLFMRRVSVAIREVRGDVSGERPLATGTLYRVALDGAPARARLELPVEFAPPVAELLVHIHNGDSPPLAVTGVAARLDPVHLRFHAPAAGRHTLLLGNPQASAPRYDLAAFASELRTAPAATVVPGAREDTPDYRPRESLAGPPLPDIPLAGAPLDAQGWKERRAVRLERAGVQELELDPAALAGARADCADLRVLHDGNQIPYVLERPALARSLTLTPVSEPDPKRPGVSRWRVTLPRAALPLQRVVLTSTTPLFSREFRLYENLPTAGGRADETTLASGGWNRTPEPGVPETRVFELGGRLQTATLWLETDNGDNPAIALDALQATYPVVRLVFKTAGTDGFTLAYDNPEAAAPRYDLSLVTVRLLTAPRTLARLEPAAPPAAPSRFAGLGGGAIFWDALGLVVVVLLVVVAKLLPKPPAA